MDVIGIKPVSDKGEYFRNSIWLWHPLASYCAQVAPAIAASCECWHTNDGDGLNAEDARALADALEAEVASGRCRAYAMMRDAESAARASDRPIDYRDFDAFLDEIANSQWTSGHFSVDNVRAFIVFLRESGGFSIW
jgi:hypothetical protein